MPAPVSGMVVPSADADDSTIDIRSAWDPKKVNKVFDPVAQWEPSDHLYSFCFTEYDQRWIQMDALDVDHTALHEPHPVIKGYMRMKMQQWPFVSLNVPKPTTKHMRQDFFQKIEVTVILEKQQASMP